jgi:hypothetical protein
MAVVKKMYFHILYSSLKHSGSNIYHQSVRLKHFTYSPHGVFVCLVRLPEGTSITSLNSIIRLETECALQGRNYLYNNMPVHVMLVNMKQMVHGAFLRKKKQLSTCYENVLRNGGIASFFS